MSRHIDPENLDERDIQYIKERPWIADAMVREGYDNPLEAEASDETDYSSWGKSKLEAEIERRNEDRDADPIVPEGKGNKADLVAALEADDQAE